MKFALALMIAVHFWGERNVHVPCHPAAVTGLEADAVLPKDVYGFPAPMGAEPSNCLIFISSADERERKQGAGNWYCADIVHEVGHIGGLEHTPTGIMSAVGNVMPYDCQHWRHFVRELRSSKPPSL